MSTLWKNWMCRSQAYTPQVSSVQYPTKPCQIEIILQSVIICNFYPVSIEMHAIKFVSVMDWNHTVTSYLMSVLWGNAISFEYCNFNVWQTLYWRKKIEFSKRTKNTSGWFSGSLADLPIFWWGWHMAQRETFGEKAPVWLWGALAVHLIQYKFWPLQVFYCELFFIII